MKKRLCSKLTLNRETLSVLGSETMVEVQGGVKTLNGTCPGNSCLTCGGVSICEIC